MKVFYTFIFCILIFSLLTVEVNAQSSVSISTGISKDINNSISFYQLPFSVMWKPSKRKKAPLFLELDYAVPFGSKSSGEAYTLNPALPQKVILQEKIMPYTFTLSVGFRIHLFTTKTNNAFYLNFIPLGICSQNIKVLYKKFDKENYEILNPDVNSDESGLVMSLSPVYYFHKEKQDMMIMLHLQTPLLKGDRDYALSYKYLAPLQLTIGYNLS
ncbi:MAG: hypothetical protein ABI359_13470, partial [Ginsengibacter sp.]